MAMAVTAIRAGLRGSAATPAESDLAARPRLQLATTGLDDFEVHTSARSRDAFTPE
jgi:hypothetical protein